MMHEQCGHQLEGQLHFPPSLPGLMQVSMGRLYSQFPTLTLATSINDTTTYVQLNQIIVIVWTKIFFYSLHLGMLSCRHSLKAVEQ